MQRPIGSLLNGRALDLIPFLTEDDGPRIEVGILGVCRRRQHPGHEGRECHGKKRAHGKRGVARMPPQLGVSANGRRKIWISSVVRRIDSMQGIVSRPGFDKTGRNSIRQVTLGDGAV
jgi:hypothetical protein